MEEKNNQKPSTTRERILSAAHDLFYRDGIRATGIDRIIAEASVTKVTFYRHFHGKNDLIRAFLEYRHQRWIHWFVDALKRHGGKIDALTPALEEWFRSPDFRGCAFINTVGELGADLPDVLEITRHHKADMEDAIHALLPTRENSKQIARVLAVAVDGAIIRAQYDQSTEVALMALEQIRRAFT